MAEGWSRFALRFGEYYRTQSANDLWTPPRLRNREWMFIPWGGKPPDRHRGFNDSEELHHYLKQRTPHSCFHSTAYYKFPSERKMIDKDWMGADLIFDLDGDHLPGVSDNDFPSMIEKIQEQAWTLWADFLQPEFGFDERFVQTSFSGHRGFHIHLRDPSLLHLDSNARRQMVNYIRGEGINVQTVLSGNESGWKNRIQNGVDSVAMKLREINEGGSQSKEIIREFKEIMEKRSKTPDFSSAKFSDSIFRELAESTLNEDRLKRLENDSSLRVFGENNTALFWELVKGDNSVVLGNAGETDESVTVDVKRVIRWIGSLHGKCGLRVTDIPLERLEPNTRISFDPLTEAIPFQSKRNFSVKMKKDQVVARINDELVEGSIGDTYSVSENMATFLSLKGWADITK